MLGMKTQSNRERRCIALRCLAVTALLLPGFTSMAQSQSFTYGTELQGELRHIAGEEWFTGVEAVYTPHELPFNDRYVLAATRRTLPRTEYSAGLRFGEDKLHRDQGDRYRSGHLSAAFLVADDVAIGPLLRYDLRQSGVGTDFTRDYHTISAALMVDVYGERIRMRWIAGAVQQRSVSWSAAWYHGSELIPASTWTRDSWSVLLENQMSVGTDIAAYTHVIRLFGDGGLLVYRPEV